MANYHHVIESFTLVTGTKGIFHFVVDGQTLFSKKEIGRHAETGEILQLFEQHIGHDVQPYSK